MINNITNVDTHLHQANVVKASQSYMTLATPPILGFKTVKPKEKAIIRYQKIKRSDNVAIVGEIDDNYVDIVEEEIAVPPVKTAFISYQPEPIKHTVKYLKNCYILDYIQSPIQRHGLGVEAMKNLVEKVMFDPRAEGRIVTYSTPFVQESSPAIFFYKIGFRFMNPEANEYIEECLRKNIPDIPIQTGMMYLPRYQLHKLLRYGEKF